MFTTTTPTQKNPRRHYFIGFLVVCAMLGVSYYLQVYQNINPCPLCILQRFAIMGVGMFCLLGALLRLERRGQLTISMLAYLFALCGALLAARQVWLQHLPPSASPDCGASLAYMLQALPFLQVLQHILSGSAECSLVDWRFLQMSLAEWSLISFCGFLFFTANLFFAALRTPRHRFF